VSSYLNCTTFFAIVVVCKILTLNKLYTWILKYFYQEDKTHLRSLSNFMYSKCLTKAFFVIFQLSPLNILPYQYPPQPPSVSSLASIGSVGSASLSPTQSVSSNSSSATASPDVTGNYGLGIMQQHSVDMTPR
jgi:hypothetical protein